MYLYIYCILLGIPLYWLILPAKIVKATPQKLAPLSDVLPLGGEQQ